jgi:hypothetical protein
MTIRMHHRAGLWLTVGVLVTLATAPRPVAAQCSMMGGSGSDHSAMHAQDVKKTSGAQKKLQQGIDDLLSDEHGRTMLASALLNDRAFVQDFIQRLAAIPEWRAMAIQQLGSGSPDGSLSAPKPEPQSAALYVCPMHPDVTSMTQGDCPKCGMRLERKRPDHS